MARRAKSFHHNLGEGNVVYHREHRSKRGRTNNYKAYKIGREFKRRKEELYLNDLEMI